MNTKDRFVAARSATKAAREAVSDLTLDWQKIAVRMYENLDYAVGDLSIDSDDAAKLALERCKEEAGKLAKLRALQPAEVLGKPKNPRMQNLDKLDKALTEAIDELEKLV